MQDDLLRWYNTELSFLRRIGAEFAQEHPKIAARLKLGPESSHDPHVERLIEAVAFLNARTRQKIEDDFPELSNAVLEVLQPQFLAPIPSMMIVQLGLSDSEWSNKTGYLVGRGTGIETEPVNGEPCRFRTGYPVTLWPVKLTGAECSGRPFAAPMTAKSSQAAAVIELRLKGLSADAPLNQLQWSTLRFFLSGLPQLTYPLYEALFNNVLEIAIAGSAKDPAPLVLGPEAILPVGFEGEEILLPGSPRTAWEYRLLTEFFVFPQKFLFFDLNGLADVARTKLTDELRIYIYLNRNIGELENQISTETFQLGCTPAINLFAQRADPVYLSQTDFEYLVSGDVRRPDEVEVYSIDRVTAQDAQGEELEFAPFYSADHLGTAGNEPAGYWHATRRDAELSETDAKSGTDLYISFVDLGFKTLDQDDWIVDVETTCLNRDLPEKLPFGSSQPQLTLSQEAGGVGRVRALTPATATIRPKMLNQARWKLISHLSIDHLSIVGAERAAEALREMLAIYDFEESTASRNLIQTLTRVESRRVTRRIHAEDYTGVCRGIETTITFDHRRVESKRYLLACVLERFLGQACSINSFSQLVVKVEKEDTVLREWPPRAGKRVLL